jgi:hypothetical protein
MVLNETTAFSFRRACFRVNKSQAPGHLGVNLFLREPQKKVLPGFQFIP